MKNEFKEAVELINSCIGSVKAEVSFTSDEGFYAYSLYFRCREFMDAYDEHGVREV